MSLGNLADTARPMSPEKRDELRAKATGQKTDDGYIVTDLGAPILDDGKYTDSFAIVQLNHPDGDEKKGIIRFINKDLPEAAIEHHRLINQLDPTLMPEILGYTDTAIILDSKLLQDGKNKFWDNGFDHLALNENLESNYNKYMQDHTALMIRLAKASKTIQENGGLTSTQGIYPAAGWHNPIKNVPGNQNFAHLEPRLKGILEHAATYKDAIEKRIEHNGPALLLAGNTQPGLVRYTNAGTMLQSIETNFAQIAYAMRHPNVQPSANRDKENADQILALSNTFNRQAMMRDQAAQFNAAGFQVDVSDIAAATMLHSARMIIGQLGVLRNENISDIDRVAARAFIEQLADTYEKSEKIANLDSLDI